TTSNAIYKALSAGQVVINAGDFDGDGWSDFAVSLLSRSPRLDQSGAYLVHSIGALYRGDANFFTTTTPLQPSMVFEPAVATYVDETGATTPQGLFAFVGATDRPVSRFTLQGDLITIAAALPGAQYLNVDVVVNNMLSSGAATATLDTSGGAGN